MKTARDRFADQSPAAALRLAADARDAAKDAAARMSAGELEELRSVGVILISISMAEQINRTRRLQDAALNEGALQ